MKAELPIIGKVATGKDANPKTVVKTRTKTVYKDSPVKVAEKAVTTNTLMGGFFEFSNKTLSDEKTVSNKLLKANTGWVYRNNDVIAKEVGAMDLELYSIKIVGGDFEYTKIDTHPLLDALDRFNDTTTKQDGMYLTQSHKKLTGDAFWLLDWQGNELANIYLLQPDKVELDLGTPNDKTDDIVKGYKYRDVIDGKEVEAYYKPDQIIHFKSPNPNNPFRGLGAVEAAAETIDTDNLAQETMKKFYLNGAIINFILSTEGKITDAQLKRLRAELKANYSGVANAYKTMILGGGLEPKSISQTNREQEFLAQLEWYRDKIMVIFGNTKASLGIVDDVNRATHESAMVSWRKNSVKPEMQAIVNTLNEFLVPRYGNNLVLTFSDPVGEDRTALLEEAKVLKEHDIADNNEVREMLGLEARPNPVNDELRAERPQPELPPALENIDVKQLLRRRGYYDLLSDFRVIKEEARKIALRVVQLRKKSVTKADEAVSPQREHKFYSNDQVWEYWGKQIRLVEVTETKFKNKVSQFINEVKEEALANFTAEASKSAKIKTKALVNEDQLEIQAQLDFTPILRDISIAAGQEALDLIDVDDPYIPDLDKIIRRNIKKFTQSMLHTEREKMAQIIADGTKAGKSVPMIRAEMEAAFDELNRVQSERITRTEVIRASNEASVDAWEQSGVVEGKQWLTAEDDRTDESCSELNGKIISLSGTYIGKGEEFLGNTYDYEPIDEPPLHPNCRCVVLPVLLSEKSVAKQKARLKKQITKLEEKIQQDAKFIEELKAQANGDKTVVLDESVKSNTNRG